MPSSACKKCALRSEEHTSELQSHDNLVCRLLLENKRAHVRTPVRRSPSVPTSASTQPHGAELHVARWVGLGRPPGAARVRGPALFRFFFNNPAPTEIHPLPPHAVFRF